MQIGIIGINHFSSKLSQREQVAKVCNKNFVSKLAILSIYAVLLSTCNRTEIYFSASCLTDAHSKILQLLREEMQDSFDQSFYSYFGGDCFFHLARVVSGMDSLIFGESDIQRQVKIAYEMARQKRQLTSALHYLFQKGLKIGKEIRTSILPSHTLLPKTIYSLIEYLNSEKKTVLFIGNSAINRVIISYFISKGFQHLVLCTRTKNIPFPSVQLINWEEIEKWDEYDAVISGTYHQEYVIKSFSHKLKTPIALFDLGIPRNIDPSLSFHPHLRLYNIDDLSKMTNQSKQISQKQIQLCEIMIEKAVSKHVELFERKQAIRWRYMTICEKFSISS